MDAGQYLSDCFWKGRWQCQQSFLSTFSHRDEGLGFAVSIIACIASWFELFGEVGSGKCRFGFLFVQIRSGVGEKLAVYSARHLDEGPRGDQ
ncbi:hypothetical protein N7465_011137 [Penicillium sp. CMV-2018d]|nr:hypothetical protein N7465_011137 [Penicillium sp. CMV-2018d]